ncbi:MAG: histidine kinase dimerization/phospho-acceptor domain-containing protein, partial [Bdellovibrionales bacterium]|nr:histidine kinase dimerization/phospho-acceptor domain-containing protein [Bdellovibrionales bacterium]
RSDDRAFLNPISEAVTLAVTRLRSLERMEQIKHEWEETFNAITHPVAVLDENLRLVRGNRALLKGRAPEQVVGRPCYEAVFDRKSACGGCPVMADYTSGRFRQRRRSQHGGGSIARAAQFRIENISLDASLDVTSEVSSRPLTTEAAAHSLGERGDEAILVHLYRDATTTVQFEKRIVESSKMAELGTIGSSIAHQLNNPIGGMLSHIQLLLMDMKTLKFEGKEDLETELREMENGTRRCAEIVRDLLGFSRRADEDEAHEHDLIEIVRQAMKITELQTRSKGIRFKLELEPSNLEEAPIQGRFNLLAQAVRAILLTLLSGSLRDLVIGLKIVKSSDELTVVIGPIPILSGSPTDHHERSDRLDLTVARQILLEHGGRLELETTTQQFEMGKEQLVQRANLSLPLTKVLGP